MAAYLQGVDHLRDLQQREAELQVAAYLQGADHLRDLQQREAELQAAAYLQGGTTCGTSSRGRLSSRWRHTSRGQRFFRIRWLLSNHSARCSCNQTSHKQFR